MDIHQIKTIRNHNVKEKDLIQDAALYNSAHEIDLSLAIRSLWDNKTTIIAFSLVTTTIALIYVLTKKPTYQVSTELFPPSLGSIEAIEPVFHQSSSETFIYTPQAPLKQQQELLDLIRRSSNTSSTKSFEIINEKPNIKVIYAIFVRTLESHAHIIESSKNNPKLLKDAFGIIFDDNIIQNVKAARNIKSPSSPSQENDLQPGKYSLVLEGIDRSALKAYAFKDLELASEKASEQVKGAFLGQLKKYLKQSQAQQATEINSLKSRIKARESYLIATRDNEIALLKEKLEALKRVNDTQNSEKNRVLVKLEQLKARTDKTFYDDDLINLYTQIDIVKNSATITQLKTEIERIKSSKYNLKFYDHTTISAPLTPIKPQKKVIVIASLLFGLITGILFTILKAAYKKQRPI